MIGAAIEFLTQGDAQAAASALTGQTLTVTGKKVEIVEEAPPPPYDTATLLEDAANLLHWRSERTMQAAQALFEGIELYGVHVGLITYHRSDSQEVAPEAKEAARQVIARLYGKDAQPPVSPRFSLPALGWGTPSPSDDHPHEAIRPTDPARQPQSLLFSLDADGQLLYRMIWERFIASQMRPAKYRVTTVELEPDLSNSEKLGKE